MKTLVDALNGLIKLVRAEYPECSLREIAITWGEGLTPLEISAVGGLDAGTTEFVTRCLPNGAQSIEIEGS